MLRQSSSSSPCFANLLLLLLLLHELDERYGLDGDMRTFCGLHLQLRHSSSLNDIHIRDIGLPCNCKSLAVSSSTNYLGSWTV